MHICNIKQLHIHIKLNSNYKYKNKQLTNKALSNLGLSIKNYRFHFHFKYKTLKKISFFVKKVGYINIFHILAGENKHSPYHEKDYYSTPITDCHG